MVIFKQNIIKITQKKNKPLVPENESQSSDYKLAGNNQTYDHGLVCSENTNCLLNIRV